MCLYGNMYATIRAKATIFNGFQCIEDQACVRLVVEGMAPVSRPTKTRQDIVCRRVSADS